MLSLLSFSNRWCSTLLACGAKGVGKDVFSFISFFFSFSSRQAGVGEWLIVADTASHSTFGYSTVAQMRTIPVGWGEEQVKVKGATLSEARLDYYWG